MVLLNMVGGCHWHEKDSGKIREMKKRLGCEVRKDRDLSHF